MESINLILGQNDNFFIQEAYKVLRTNLQFCGRDVKVIAITSCNENEGKTTVSLNIAMSFAEVGKKVLYIDADMRKSVVVSRYTDSKRLKGLSELLTGIYPVGECIYACQNPKLHLIVAGKYPPNPAELLNGKYFASLIAECKRVYDYVIIDTPPLGRVIDAAVISSNSDGAVLVIGDKKTNYRQAQECVAQLQKSGCAVLGVVRNYVSAKHSKYYKKY